MPTRIRDKVLFTVVFNLEKPEPNCRISQGHVNQLILVSVAVQNLSQSKGFQEKSTNEKWEDFYCSEEE